jgi:hypothetical protein
MKIKLLPGDHEWSVKGTHVCDACGIAKILEEELELDVDDSIADKIMPIIEHDRLGRGLMPDGSLPPPPPPPPPPESWVTSDPPIEAQPAIEPLMQATKAKKKKEV